MRLRLAGVAAEICDAFSRGWVCWWGEILEGLAEDLPTTAYLSLWLRRRGDDAHVGAEYLYSGVAFGWFWVALSKFDQLCSDVCWMRFEVHLSRRESFLVFLALYHLLTTLSYPQPFLKTSCNEMRACKWGGNGFRSSKIENEVLLVLAKILKKKLFLEL